MEKIYVGIDIAKKTFVAAAHFNNKQKTKNFKNTEEGFEKLLTWLKIASGNNYHFCMESTGHYGQALAIFLYDKNFTVSVINPAQIKHFIRSQLMRNKTDSIDAKMILRYGELIQPLAWHPEPQEIQLLQAFVNRLDVLIEMRSQEQNRLESANKSVSKSIESTIEYLTREIKNIEQEIQQHINQHPSLQNKAELLKSIPGVGERTISKILAFLSQVEKFDKVKQIAAYVGLNPQQHQSGHSINRPSKLSKTGKSELRKTLYMPAVVAIKHNPIIKKFYNHLLKKGKRKKVALCAAMRKLIHMIYGVLKSGKPFDESFA